MGTVFTLKRLVLVGILIGIVIGYVGPVRGYLAQRESLAAESARLADLEARRDHFARCLDALNNPVVLEMVAREYGLGRPGERVFNIPGLKRATSSGCAGDPTGG
jgi:cell division protein FtsB